MKNLMLFPKKTFSFVLFLLLTFSLVDATPAEQIPSELFVNESKGYCISIPEELLCQRFDKQFEDVYFKDCSGEKLFNIEVLSYKQFLEVLHVNPNTECSLEQLASIAKKKFLSKDITIKKNAFKKTVKTQTLNGMLADIQLVTLQGIPMVRASYVSRDKTPSDTVVFHSPSIYYVLRDDQVYLFLFQSSNPEKQEQMLLLDQIMESLRLL